MLAKWEKRMIWHLIFQNSMVRGGGCRHYFIRLSGWTENGSLFPVQNQRRR